MNDQLRKPLHVTKARWSPLAPGTPQKRPLPAEPEAAPVAGPRTQMGPGQARPRQHSHWNLLINVPVEIRHNGRVVRTGIVDDAMPDSSALWIAADANEPRQMYTVAEGYQVWVVPTWW